ncbi:MAG: hypothetical protein M3Y18_09375 [Candidatus Eremiobacteraeota bacterium]|nr:hypothetical protein [Candidatus Eremiobacteraeota bacterium]
MPQVGLTSIANNPDIVEGLDLDEIDRAIRRYAEPSYLWNQPLVDRSFVRVAGPFTVESFAPAKQ